MNGTSHKILPVQRTAPKPTPKSIKPGTRKRDGGKDRTKLENGTRRSHRNFFKVKKERKAYTMKAESGRVNIGRSEVDDVFSPEMVYRPEQLNHHVNFYLATSGKIPKSSNASILGFSVTLGLALVAACGIFGIIFYLLKGPRSSPEDDPTEQDAEGEDSGYNEEVYDMAERNTTTDASNIQPVQYSLPSVQNAVENGRAALNVRRGSIGPFGNMAAEEEPEKELGIGRNLPSLGGYPDYTAMWLEKHSCIHKI